MKFTVLIALFLALSLSPVYAEPPEGGTRGPRAGGQDLDKEAICAKRAERRAAHANREGGGGGRGGAGGPGRRGSQGSLGGKGGKGGKHGKGGKGGKGRHGPKVDCG